MPIDHQAVICANRDTLYSGGGVFNLDVGPMTVTLPDVGKHFMSPEVFDEDEYVVEIASPGHLGYGVFPSVETAVEMPV